MSDENNFIITICDNLNKKYRYVAIIFIIVNFIVEKVSHWVLVTIKLRLLLLCLIVISQFYNVLLMKISILSRGAGGR